MTWQFEISEVLYNKFNIIETTIFRKIFCYIIYSESYDYGRIFVDNQRTEIELNRNG